MDHLQDKGENSKPPPGLQALAEGEISSMIDLNIVLLGHTATAADWFAAKVLSEVALPPLGACLASLGGCCPDCFYYCFPSVAELSWALFPLQQSTLT